jgi:hypothetical protein
VSAYGPRGRRSGIAVGVCAALVLPPSGLARAADPADGEVLDESAEASGVAPPADPDVLVMAALLAGAGFTGRYGPGFGTRIGMLFPIGAPRALGSGDLYFGGGFLYHRATDRDDPPRPEAIEGWSVTFAAEAGFGLHLPLVTLMPMVGAGVVRSSTTSCLDALCNTDSVADVYFAPGAVLQTSPTSPLAPFFLGIDGRYATSFGAEGLQSFLLFGTGGLRI